jgi:hypothetical protein
MHEHEEPTIGDDEASELDESGRDMTQHFLRRGRRPLRRKSHFSVTRTGAERR